MIILEGHPAQWASVLDEFCGPVNYKCQRRDFVSGGKKKNKRKQAEVKVRETFSRILGKMALKLLLLLFFFFFFPNFIENYENLLEL